MVSAVKFMAKEPFIFLETEFTFLRKYDCYWLILSKGTNKLLKFTSTHKSLLAVLLYRLACVTSRQNTKYSDSLGPRISRKLFWDISNCCLPADSFIVSSSFHHGCYQASYFLFSSSNFLLFVGSWVYRGPLLWNRKLL